MWQGVGAHKKVPIVVVVRISGLVAEGSRNIQPKAECAGVANPTVKSSSSLAHHTRFALAVARDVVVDNVCFPSPQLIIGKALKELLRIGIKTLHPFLYLQTLRVPVPGVNRFQHGPLELLGPN